MSSQEEEIDRIAKEITDKVCYYATPNQYVADSEEQKAYLEGVSTAIAMLYIDLTGTPKTKGILASLTEAHKVEMEKMVEEMLVEIEDCKVEDAPIQQTILSATQGIIKSTAKKFNIEVK